MQLYSLNYGGYFVLRKSYADYLSGTIIIRVDTELYHLFRSQVNDPA